MENTFKGTKGKWHKQQNKQGDIIISAVGFEALASVNFYPEGFREKYINGKITGSPAPDSAQFRTECIYNAKLIVKAPEMLEALKETYLHIYSLSRVLPDDSDYKQGLKGRAEQIKNLIKSATEL